MQIVPSIMTKNPCYTAGKKIVPKGLMLHSVGCAQPRAEVFIGQFNKETYNAACVHAFIDGNTGYIYQTLPWDHRGWHCGGSANNTHIGVEMCEPASIKYTSGANFTIAPANILAAQTTAKRTYDVAVELFAYLCVYYKLNPLADGVIISHAEGNKLGLTSPHTDPEHLWKGLGMSYTMDGFRKDVAKAVDAKSPTEKDESKILYRVRKSWTDYNGQLGAYYDLNNAINCAKTKAGYKVYGTNGTIVWQPEETPPKENSKLSYQVRVSISNLNIRTGPGTRYPATGVTGKGVFTIVETASGEGSVSGWGLLKSYEKGRNGWISLDYALKV